MTKLPKKVVLGIDSSGRRVFADVRETLLPPPCLGCIDCRKREILINPDQPEVGKRLILLHEMIHATAEAMKMNGDCKRQPSEAFVTALAGNLFVMLGLSGLWNGVSPAEVVRFIRSEVRKRGDWS